MNRFLAYFSQSIAQDFAAINAIHAEVLARGGKFISADFCVKVICFTEDERALWRLIKNHANDGSFFIVETSQISYSGDDQFDEALKQLDRGSGSSPAREEPAKER